MCEKQKRIEELELENAELYKTIAEIGKLNAEKIKFDSETEYNNTRTQYHWAQVIGLPLMVSMIGVIIAIVNS